MRNIDVVACTHDDVESGGARDAGEAERASSEPDVAHFNQGAAAFELELPGLLDRERLVVEAQVVEAAVPVAPHPSEVLEGERLARERPFVRALRLDEEAGEIQEEVLVDHGDAEPVRRHRAAHGLDLSLRGRTVEQGPLHELRRFTLPRHDEHHDLQGVLTYKGYSLTRGTHLQGVLTYKGYSARIAYDDEDGIFTDRVAGIRDGVGFHADSVEALQQAFHEAVLDYLETCAKVGKEPQKAYSGRMMFRVSPEVHRPAPLGKLRLELAPVPGPSQEGRARVPPSSLPTAPEPPRARRQSGAGRRARSGHQSLVNSKSTCQQAT